MISICDSVGFCQSEVPRDILTLKVTPVAKFSSPNLPTTTK